MHHSNTKIIKKTYVTYVKVNLYVTLCLNKNVLLLITFCFRIIDGFEALDDLEKMAVNPKTYRPLTESRITSVTIHANPLAG